MRRISEGMPGGRELRAIDVGEHLWAIVQSVPEADYGETALARGLQNLDWVGPRAIAHEHVIDLFLSAPALLPMHLFTLFTSDDRVVQHVHSDRTRVRRLLKRVEEARSAADQMYKSMVRLAAAAQRRTGLERAAPGSRLLLDAAFLVPVAKSGAFRSAVRQRTRDLRDAGITMSLTGPWPPYNFVE